MSQDWRFFRFIVVLTAILCTCAYLLLSHVQEKERAEYQAAFDQCERLGGTPFHGYIGKGRNGPIFGPWVCLAKDAVLQ